MADRQGCWGNTKGEMLPDLPMINWVSPTDISIRGKGIEHDYSPHLPMINPVQLKNLTAIQSNELLSFMKTQFGIDYLQEHHIILSDESIQDLSAQFSRYQPDLANTLIALWNHMGSSGTKCYWDISEGNIMKRGSTLVLVDPTAP